MASLNGGIKMTGTDIEQYFVKEAEKLGYVCFKLDRLPGGKSNPDQLVMGGGSRLFIEFKSKHEKVKGHQERRHLEIMAKQAGTVWICRTKDVADTLLRRLKLDHPISGGDREYY